jgi:streptogramin lyase
MRLLPVVGILASLCVCACGRGAHLESVVPRSPAPTTTLIHLRISSPAQSVSDKRRRALSVALNTAGIAITVYKSPRALNPNPIANLSANVSPTSALCTTAGGSRSCSVPIAAPVGTDDFVVQTYDAAPLNGSFASAKQLGYGSASSQTIAFGSAPVIGFSLAGVVAGVAVTIPNPQIDPKLSTSEYIDVAALDADRNVIISDGNGYVDASGNPVTLTIGVANGGSALTVSPATLGAPSPTGVLLTYASGNLTSSQAAAAFSATITATPSNAGASSGTAALTFTQELTQNSSGLPAGALRGLAQGADGRIWIANFGANQIDAFNPATGIFTTYAVASGASPMMTALGGDGNIWFSEYAGGKIARITPAGAITEYAVNPAPIGIAAGPDGRVWFVDGTQISTPTIGAINPATGAITHYSTGLTGGAIGLFGIAAGPDGRLWFTELNANRIGAITTAGAITEYSTGISSGAAPLKLCAGSDGRMWFTEVSGNRIGAITTTGIVTEYAIATPASGPYGIAAGPDGRLWFTQATTNQISAISTSGAIQTLPGGLSNNSEITTTASGQMYATGISGGTLLGIW